MPQTDLSIIMSEATLRLLDLNDGKMYASNDFLRSLGDHFKLIGADDTATDAALHLYAEAAHLMPAQILEALIDFSADVPETAPAQEKIMALIDTLATPRVIHDMVVNGHHNFPTFRNINSPAAKRVLNEHIRFAPENLSFENISVLLKIASVVGQSMDSLYTGYRLENLEDVSARVLMAIVKNELHDGKLDGMHKRRDALKALMENNFDALVQSIDPSFIEKYARPILTEIMTGPFKDIYDLSKAFMSIQEKITDSRIYAPIVLDLYVVAMAQARNMHKDIFDFNGRRAAASLAYDVASYSSGFYLMKKMAFDDHVRLAPRKTGRKLKKYNAEQLTPEYALADFGRRLIGADDPQRQKHRSEGEGLMILAAQKARANYSEGDANKIIRAIFAQTIGYSEVSQDTQVALIEARFYKDLGKIDLVNGLKPTEELPESETKQLVAEMRGFTNITSDSSKMYPIITALLLKRATNDAQRLDVLAFMGIGLDDAQKESLAQIFKRHVAIDPNAALPVLKASSQIANYFFGHEHRVMPKFYRSMLTEMINVATKLSPENQKDFAFWAGRSNLEHAVYGLSDKTLDVWRAFNAAVKPQMDANHPAFRATSVPTARLEPHS